MNALARRTVSPSAATASSCTRAVPTSRHAQTRAASAPQTSPCAATVDASLVVKRVRSCQHLGRCEHTRTGHNDVTRAQRCDREHNDVTRAQRCDESTTMRREHSRRHKPPVGAAYHIENLNNKSMKIKIAIFIILLTPIFIYYIRTNFRISDPPPSPCTHRL